MKHYLARNLSFLAIGTVAFTLSVLPMLGGTIATPHVAGDFQGWNPGSNPMTETFLGSDIWTSTFTGLTPGSRHEWKVTDGTFGSTVPGPNSWFFADAAGNITMTYDGNTYGDGWSSTTDRLGLSTAPASWTAVGDWQSQVGGGNWDNGNASTLMTSLGGGIFQFTATLTPGSYSGKTVVSGSWDSISVDSRSVNTANWNFVTDAVNNTVTFRVDGFKGVSQVLVTPVPEPSILALGSVGLVGLLVARRRK